ncbi:MAG: hypothetical protein ACOVP1_09080 [Bacteroidia bacterium]
MSRIHLFILGVLFFYFSFEVKAQQVWQPIVHYPREIKLLKAIPIDSQNMVRQLELMLLSQLQAECYFLAQQDSLSYSKNRDTLFTYWESAKKFQNITIRKGNLPNELVEDLRWPNQKVLQNEIALKSVKEKVLQYALNNGYPFAQVSFDSVLIDSERVSAAMHLSTGPLVYFDSLDFAGTSELKLKYLRSFCHIKPGSIYNESVLAGTNALLSELPYISITRPIGVYFYGNKAKPYVYIDKKKAGSFDGIIGFAPNSSLNNKLVITGDINLKLQNILGSGKSFEVGFRSFLNGSQDLFLQFNWPYFLQSRFDIEETFKLLRFDSIYIDLNNEIGIQYRSFGKSSLKVLYQYQSVSLLNVDTNSIKQSKNLPAFHDTQSDLIGINFKFKNLNHFYNPSKGSKIEFELLGGSRRIVKNQQINDLMMLSSDNRFYNLYDSLKLQSIQLKFKFNYSFYYPVYKQFILHFDLSGAHVYAEKLFQNELFRIGGLKTLRGFDEQSIFANTYLLGNVEIKYLIPENSSFVLFYNKAYVQNNLVQINKITYPEGLGAGMNIESEAGVFSLFYAMGSQSNKGIQLNNARIHFGFVNFF